MLFTSEQPKKIHRFCLLGLFFVFFLTSCENKKADIEPPILHIYSWADYIPPYILKQFSKETNIQVTYDVFENNESLEAKLLIGGKDFDLVFPSASPFLARQIRASLYKKIDKSKIPNYKFLDENVLQIVSRVDPGNHFGIPYVWGTSGVGYNKKLVQDALGKAPPKSWKLLFDPMYSDKLEKCGVSLIEVPFDVIAPILAYLGLSPNSYEKKDLRKAFSVLTKIRKNIRNFQSVRSSEDLLAGNLCVAQVWSGNLLQAQVQEKELCLLKNSKKECEQSAIQYFIPEEGAEMWCDCMAIPINAEHPNNALKFINFILRPKIAAEITNYLLFASANKAARKYVKKELLQNSILYPPKSVMKKLFVERKFPANLERWRARQFIRIKKKGSLNG